MAIPININGGGKDFEPLSEGLHTLILADVADLGIEETPFGKKQKVRLVWLSDEADSEGYTKRVFEKFTASLHEKATLRGRVKEILGRDLTEAEIAAKTFDIESLIGAQKVAIIEHNTSNNGKVYANIKGLLKQKPTTRLAIPSDFVRYKDNPKNQKAAPAPARTTGGGRAAAAAVLAPPTPITDDDIPF